MGRLTGYRDGISAGKEAALQEDLATTLQLVRILLQLLHEPYVGAHDFPFCPYSGECFVRSHFRRGDEVRAYDSCAPTDAHETVNLQ